MNWVLVVIMLWYFISFNDPQWYLEPFDSVRGYKARKKKIKLESWPMMDCYLAGNPRTLKYSRFMENGSLTSSFSLNSLEVFSKQKIRG